ncbi:GlxA family transcriptional regulator [Pandoraea capi]|nr:helix-turn-helix domain-containing protein [Pandoraea capi]
MTTTIRIWVYDGILASGVAGPIDVFHAANRISARDKGHDRHNPALPFAWRVESPDGQPVRAAAGQTIAVDGKIEPDGRADAILLTAPYLADMDEFIARHATMAALTDALRRHHRAGAILAAYCTANFLLAEAGLLDDRTVDLRREQAAEFARRYPRYSRHPTVELRAQEIVMSHDGIMSSAAVTSYLNLAVRLVGALANDTLASATAKALSIDMHRTSRASTSYASLLREHGHPDPLVARAQKRMETNLRHRFRLSELAASLAVSERTLNRRFKHATGQAPLEYLQNLRIEFARRMLESRPVALGELSQSVGYEDVGTFRDLFRRKTGLSPREYQIKCQSRGIRRTTST